MVNSKYTAESVKEYARTLNVKLTDEQIDEIIKCGNEFNLELSRAYNLVMSKPKKYVNRYKTAKRKLFTTIPADSSIQLYKNELNLSKSFIKDGISEVDEITRNYIYNTFYKTTMFLKCLNSIRRRKINDEKSYFIECKLYNKNETLKNIISRYILGKDSYEEYLNEKNKQLAEANESQEKQ